MVLPNVHSLGYKAGQAIHHVISSHTIDIPPLVDIWDFLRGCPSLYKEWWLNLVTKDPIHVFVETTLLLSIIYMIVQKQKDWREDHKERLTATEQKELLLQWRDERAPLAPPRTKEKSQIIVRQNHGRTMEISQGISGECKTVLNFCTYDFLGMASTTLSVDDKEEAGPGVAVKNASRKALSRYGCGSCGPRGFYGTIDVHLELEDAISKFTDTEGAILYSDGASTVSSTIAAFAKRGDLLVVDEGVYEPLVTGISLSRANVEWFRHNDMVRVCINLVERDERLRDKKRKFFSNYLFAILLLGRSSSCSQRD